MLMEMAGSRSCRGSAFPEDGHYSSSSSHRRCVIVAATTTIMLMLYVSYDVGTVTPCPTNSGYIR